MLRVDLGAEGNAASGYVGQRVTDGSFQYVCIHLRTVLESALRIVCVAYAGTERPGRIDRSVQ